MLAPRLRNRQAVCYEPWAWFIAGAISLVHRERYNSALLSIRRGKLCGGHRAGVARIWKIAVMKTAAGAAGLAGSGGLTGSVTLAFLWLRAGTAGSNMDKPNNGIYRQLAQRLRATLVGREVLFALLSSH